MQADPSTPDDAPSPAQLAVMARLRCFNEALLAYSMSPAPCLETQEAEVPAFSAAPEA